MSDLQHDLRMFTGTDQWFRHRFNSNLLYTDGVKFFAEHCGNGAYWFLDIIATELADLQETEDFLTIDLVVKAEEAQADIIVGDGNGGELYTKHIDFTDAPDGTWKFYLVKAGNVMLLPSEY